MTLFGPDDFEGNWLWLAADQVGSLGVFETFGYAPLPKAVSNVLEDAETVNEFVATDLLNRVGASESRLFDERAWYAGSPEFELFRSFRQNRVSESEATREMENEQRILRERRDGTLRVASCGIHVFDTLKSQDGGYEHVAYPVTPLKVDQLPESIRSIVDRIRFANIQFQKIDCLTTKQIQELGSSFP